MRKQTVNMKLYKYDEVKEILKQAFTEKLASLLNQGYILCFI
ncbi:MULTISPECIES: hypothetical protein [unclassified Nosocomiicoccus]|nr:MULTISPECIES: hypothetical protein [unclassified Nosocomiicoccus]